MSNQDDRVGKPGEFRGDFTRDTFDPANSYSRVFMQQGRVSIDADWNEQVSILHHYQRLFTTATIGPHAAPWNCELDFKVQLHDERYVLRHGSYYVNGLLCYNPANTKPAKISDLLGCEDRDLENGFYLLYLDAWERHLGYIEDDSIRETALGGADTATRAQITWAVRGKYFNADSHFAEQIKASFDPTNAQVRHQYDDFIDAVFDDIKPGNGRLQARAKPSKQKADLCASDNSTGYRGKENQLYRVEVHHGGSADDATFKWSRNNSSINFPISKVAGEVVTLEHLGHDICQCLKVNDWVAVISDIATDDCHGNDLYQVVGIDLESNQVTLHNSIDLTTDSAIANHAYLRLWNNQEGDQHGIPMKMAAEQWYELEDGIEVRFPDLEKPPAESDDFEFIDTTSIRPDEPEATDGRIIITARRRYHYQSGDYWLIPARSASNSIEWPSDNNKPMAQAPHGVVHHYAPLGVFVKSLDGWQEALDCRRVISQNWQPVPQGLSIEHRKTKDAQNARPSANRSAGKKAKKKSKKTHRKARKKPAKKTGKK